MAKDRVAYICQECGYESPKWAGRCSECGEWNTFTKKTISSSSGKSGRSTDIKPVNLSKITTNHERRFSTGMEEFDRVLGGGLVSGSVVLLAGEPGIGKSTLLLQTAAAVSRRDNFTLFYICGEESPGQIKLRAQRLGHQDAAINFLPYCDVDQVTDFLKKQSGPAVVIVDSIQTMTTEELTGAAGSIGQVRKSAARLISVAKNKQFPMIMAGHVTKEGSIAGPKVLEHAVDGVVYFEGDQYGQLRLLRSIKNRFGRTGEVGVFEMTGQGLKQVKNAADIFLRKDNKKAAGTIKAVILKGTRPLVLEVQALVTQSNLAYPRRLAKGIAKNRLELQTAVLQKQLHLPLYKNDVILNVIGGVHIDEPAIDLASCLAIYSSLKNKAFSTKAVAFGEVGLLGEIRPVVEEERRIKEAKRLGYEKIISSKNASNLPEAIETLSS